MSNELTPQDKELIKILEKKVDRLYNAMFPDEQPKEVKQKERWIITVEAFNHNPNDHKIIVHYPTEHILSKTEALKISELIRETLKQL